MKVIYHVDEMERWPLTIGNVKNMVAFYEEQGEAFTIEVLANAAAVAAYRRTETKGADERKRLSDAGVIFAACSNALKANGLAREDLYDYVTVVPAGVVELAKRQSEGYAYIRP